MDWKDALTKADEMLNSAAARVERHQLTKWFVLGIIGGALLFTAWAAFATGYEHGSPEAAAIAAAQANAKGGAGGSASGGAGGSVSSNDKAYALGMAGLAASANACQGSVSIFVVGFTYTVEYCETIALAAAVHGLTNDQATVKEMLCQNPRLRQAFKTAGRPCKDPAQ